MEGYIQLRFTLDLIEPEEEDFTNMQEYITERVALFPPSSRDYDLLYCELHIDTDSYDIQLTLEVIYSPPVGASYREARLYLKDTLQSLLQDNGIIFKPSSRLMSPDEYYKHLVGVRSWGKSPVDMSKWGNPQIDSGSYGDTGPLG